MPLNQSSQLEAILYDATQNLHIQALNVYLQRDFDSDNTIQCSQQILNKLDKFICKSLEQGNSPAASLGFTVIYKCGRILKLPGGQGLSALIANGLVKKWFEKCRQLWVLGGSLRDELLLNLAEDFFDALMEVHESGNTGAINVTESFLYPIGHIAVDPRIYILIQKEAIRKFNLILDKSPFELKKDGKMLRSQEAADVMSKLASRILDGGDYDFQTALMEALCRMTTCEQRKQLAHRWFTIEHVSAAFVKIRDSEFETDCRKFLNMVNGMKGDKRSVFSYSCLEVYLGKNELLMPVDEKLEEFWIDFNIGSHSISFYFSLPNEEAQEGQWETICINETEVNSYTVKEEGKRRVLKLNLSEVVVVGSVDGSSLSIHFSCGLDILPVVQNVFSHNKNVAFVGKRGTSVVKTTVKVVMDENSATSQANNIVPESQMSLGESDKNVASIQMKTPAKRRLSESTTYISSSGGGSARCVSTVLPAGKCKRKPSLEMVGSVERPGPNDFGESRITAKTDLNPAPITSRRDSVMQQNISLTKARKTISSVPSEDEPLLDSTFVPDSQPTTGRNISSKWNKYSVSEMLMMPTQKMCSLPISVSPPSSAQRQVGPSFAQHTSVLSSGPVHPKHLHTELTQRLQQVLCERNQEAAPQCVPAQRRKMSITKDYPQTKTNNAVVESVTPDLKEKKPQRNRKVKAKVKVTSQMEEDSVVVKAPGKATGEKMSDSVKSTALSNKEKRDAEVTGKMVKQISSHYEVNSLIKVKENKITQCLIPQLTDRPFFNMKWHMSMGNVTTLVSSNSKNKTNSTTQSKDVFAFSVDTPQSIRRNKAITSSTCFSVTEESRLPSTKKKEQPPPKAKRYVKKHLFSDTDTDRGTTDVSWVRESSRKPKPKVTKYPRAKVSRRLLSCNSPDLPAPVPLKDKTNVKSTKDVVKPQQKREKAALAASRRPSRAAAQAPKNYKDSDGSQTESEFFKVGKSEKLEGIQDTNKKIKQCKSYVEPESNNSSQSESEEEQTAFSKPKFVLDETTKQGKESDVRSEQAKKKFNRKNKGHKDPIKCEKLLKPLNVLKENAEKPKNSAQKNGAQVKEQSRTLKEPWAQRQVLSPLPPSFIERMRSAEQSGPSLDLPCSPVLSLQGSPLTVSPNPLLTPTLLLPKPHTTLTSVGHLTTPSVYSAEKKKSTSEMQSNKSETSLASVTHSGQSKTCGAIRTSAVQSPVQELSSPLSLSRPLLTSTLVNQNRPNLPSLLPSLPPSQLKDVHSSRGSPISEVSFSRGSSKSSVTGKVMDKASAALRAEKTPLMDESLISAEDVVSGPSHKRHKSYSSSSNSDEEDKQQVKKSKMRTQHSPRMKPRKLFRSACKDQSVVEEIRRESRPKAAKKSAQENLVAKKRRTETYVHEDPVSAEGGGSQLLSFSRTGADVEDIDMDDHLDTPGLNPRDMCREFSCKLQQKFKSRFKMMEVYNRHSLKTVQQHISTISSEVVKHRAQGLEQVQRVLLEEIHKLELDDTVLKNMENDLTMHWNKQTMACHSLQKQEKRRNEVLRKTLQNNVCHSLEYEKEVFTSQMCLIRKDMKSAQDRLLSEMHEEEIQSVKRGLHALFFPDATGF